MERRLRAAIGGVGLAAFVSLPAGPIVAAQGSSQPGSAPRHVVIGCVSRGGMAQGRSGAAGTPTFVITDGRSKPPSTYRLDGDADQLRLHVGHTLEIAGTITPAAGARGASNGSAAPPTLKVQSITYISTTCQRAS